MDRTSLPTGGVPPCAGRPFVLLIFGAPGSGKTTLARGLAAELRLPCLHRDDFWIGLLGTHLNPQAATSAPPSSQATTSAFIDTLVSMLSGGVSCIGDDNISVRDAAHLERLLAVSRVLLIHTSAANSEERYERRLRTDPVAS